MCLAPALNGRLQPPYCRTGKKAQRLGKDDVTRAAPARAPPSVPWLLTVPLSVGLCVLSSLTHSRRKTYNEKEEREPAPLARIFLPPPSGLELRASAAAIFYSQGGCCVVVPPSRLLPSSFRESRLLTKCFFSLQCPLASFNTTWSRPPRARARPRRSHKALPEKESEMPQLASQPPHASTSFLSRLRYIGTRPRDSFFSRVGQALLLRLPWGRSAEKYRARGAGCFCLYERKYIDGGEREYDLPRYGDDGGAALSFKNSWTLRSKRMRESVRSRGCDDVLIFNFILLSYKRKFLILR